MIWPVSVAMLKESDCPPRVENSTDTVFSAGFGYNEIPISVDSKGTLDIELASKS